MIRTEEPLVDAAEDEASIAAGLQLAPAVEAIASVLRQKHLEQRMAEPDASTFSKVSKWRAGKCEPKGGRHRLGGVMR